jgi:FMN phosphatase YigB (HAD superfamily)
MPLPAPPRAITFDCWETLLTNRDWEGTIEARVEALIGLASRQEVALGPEGARELIEGSWQEHVRAWREGRPYGTEGAARWCLEQLGIPVTDSQAGELAEAIAGVTTRENTRLIEGAREAVGVIRSSGIPTALICDTGFTPGRIVRRLLEDHGMHLDHYFFSDEVGSPKPYRPIFEAALSATGSDPAAAVHIGDLRRTDIAGARAAGMATIRFAGIHDDGWEPEESSGEEADAVIYSWEEALPLLGVG